MAMPTFVSNTATILKVSAQMLSAPGGISIPGLEVGDVVIASDPQSYTTYVVENIVSVAGELQQVTQVDLSAYTVAWYLLRGV
jgi:hypothetical protein